MHAHPNTAIRPFSENPDFDFEIRTTLGRATAGAGDSGEILAATQRLPKNDHDGWVSAWSALADRTAETATGAAAKGHKISAAEAFLRASAYYSVVVDALSSLDDMPRLRHAFGRQQSMWQVSGSRAPSRSNTDSPQRSPTLASSMCPPRGRATSRTV